MNKEKILEEKILKITLAVYRVSGIFPEHSLSNEFRKLADKIYASSLRIFVTNLSLEERREFFYIANNELNVLLRFFEIAKNFKVLHEENFNILSEEYSLFFTDLKKLVLGYETQQSFFTNLFDLDLESTVQVKNEEVGRNFESQPARIILETEKSVIDRDIAVVGKMSPKIKKRHEKIVESLKNSKQGFRRQDLIAELSFSGNPRTFSRDLEFLYNKGLIDRKGDRKGAIYYIKN